MELHDILDRIYRLPDNSVEKFVQATQEVLVPKNSEIISAGRVCHDVFFVAEGIVRAFSYSDGRDITFWIGAEGAVALSMQSYINGKPGYESIVTLEDCRFFRTSVGALHSLYDSDIHIANWGRRFAESELLRTESLLIPQLFTTARQRYEAILRDQPALLNRIPLENLATYLGITPVSLSRIRRSMTNTKVDVSK